MKTALSLGLSVVCLTVLASPPVEALVVTKARLNKKGEVVVKGKNADPGATITWEGIPEAVAKNNGRFSFKTPIVPADCTADVEDGVTTPHLNKPIKKCIPLPLPVCEFPATGQTTAFQADKNDGIAGPVDVEDDGTVRAGVPLSYTDNGDGTITDNNTGLIWEKKVPGSGCLHCVDNTYFWSGNGSQETVWDWLDDVNAEGGTGFAGHNDWRIPNIKELLSIIDHERVNPAVNPVFVPTAAVTTNSNYWSASTDALNTNAWFVDFINGFKGGGPKNDTFHVRAVRGGL